MTHLHVTHFFSLIIYIFLFNFSVSPEDFVSQICYGKIILEERTCKLFVST